MMPERGVPHGMHKYGAAKTERMGPLLLPGTQGDSWGKFEDVSGNKYALESPRSPEP